MNPATRRAPLLIEIGTEELPPKALDSLAAAFASGVAEGLARNGVAFDADSVRSYCSPRRLAVLIANVSSEQPDQAIERRGPAISAGLDADGNPTRALSGFAASCGVEVAALERLETDKGAWFVHRAVQRGQPTAALLPAIVEQALKALPIPKPMRWGDHAYTFARPVHWLVMLHGADVIAASLFGLNSGRQSRGHRFHHAGPVHVADADSWLVALRNARVLADPAERRQRIVDEVARVAAETGGTPRLSADLLDEIANLTEWPVAIACAFDREFLEVPQEALVMTMESNQKFVPVFDAAGRLSEHFIGIANIDSKDPAEIRKGYERVIRPRFADAKFFYDEDRKQGLASFQDSLKSVTYQQSLGSVWDKSVRVAELARIIANRVGADAALATRAAALSKCDLMSRMVGEFPELQGIMGRYYAGQGEPPESAEVAEALDEFYRPRQAGDAIASTPIGRVLAVAERLDTLTGIFAVGMKPSGNKDPFALRRAALGLARTLIEAGLDLDLKAHLAEALAALPETALAAGLGKAKDGQPHKLDAGQRRAELAAELYEFIVDRLRGYYAERGIAGEVFEAVRALSPGSLLDFDRRLHAVVQFSTLPEAQSLAAANKRIGNILRQAGDSGHGALDPSLLESDAERELVHAVEQAEASGAPLIAAGDYVGLLGTLAALRDPVDHYFENVMVMADDERVRRNRLSLLARIRSMFLRVADVSMLPVSGAAS
ncbi:glycine--tRNA ligase subunit beta [Dokdonella immobilis]|uniref:Glycine--tRNA ligase beta subunit n=1 Tax=Dokdonella immobilis TaxID=578942 RepID=A0A1I4VLE1_9GAMM|nr:glycine--tRNA ligase subunit beta [Dokdonella immobilis]SFN02074.1 glycyl-tRNA synthetase beta chain [Dokdonella immobilis]